MRAHTNDSGDGGRSDNTLTDNSFPGTDNVVSDAGADNVVGDDGSRAATATDDSVAAEAISQMRITSPSVSHEGPTEPTGDSDRAGSSGSSVRTAVPTVE